jgi:hypothetical protein
MIKTENVCPLGSSCEEIKDGVIKKCMWHVKLVGKDPQTGEDKDEWGCAMAWIPLLLIENSRQQRSTSAAVESFRNEMVQANNQMLGHAEQALLEK